MYFTISCYQWFEGNDFTHKFHLNTMNVLFGGEYDSEVSFKYKRTHTRIKDWILSCADQKHLEILTKPHTRFKAPDLYIHDEYQHVEPEIEFMNDKYGSYSICTQRSPHGEVIFKLEKWRHIFSDNATIEDGADRIATVICDYVVTRNKIIERNRR